MTDKPDLMLMARAQAAASAKAGHDDVAEFLNALADEIELLRAMLAMREMNLPVMGALSSVVRDKVNGHG